MWLSTQQAGQIEYGGYPQLQFWQPASDAQQLRFSSPPLAFADSFSAAASLPSGRRLLIRWMARHNAHAAAARLRKGSAEHTRTSHSSDPTPPGSSPTTAVTQAAQAARARAQSVTASITQGQLRRRKRDMAREAWRRMMRLKDASGRVKVCLFLVLACSLWLLFFSTAPALPDPAKRSSAAQVKSSAAASSTGARVTPTSSVDFSRTTPEIVVAKAVRTYPHDQHAFTQGLLVHRGQMWESTGLYGQSELRRVSLETGEVQQSWRMESSHFGEGLCVWRDRLLQLTWREHVGFVYDLENFTQGPTSRFAYATEGWGITHSDNDTSIVLSDGSSTLFFMNPEDFSVQRKLKVRAFKNGRLTSVRMLNELEWIQGHIYANVWQTPLIAIIHPQTGLVVRWIDVRSLHPNPSDANATPNGVAYDEAQHKMYITGKLWSKLYEIEFVAPYA